MATKGVCLFCGTDTDSEMKCGKLITKQQMTLHYFCMLFSSALRQSGRSTRVGILGFIVKDILKEQKRGQKQRCMYCKKVGATIGCSAKKCKKFFHFPCGLENDTMHQFFGSYSSFCPEHRMTQESPSSDRFAFSGTATSVCPICLCSIETRSSFHVLRTPCCKHSWIHRICLQEQAIHFGYFFRCPLCNNKEEFQVEMLTNGIYIPEQDASWELEENAFQELLYRHNRCDHPKCRCPDGPNYNKDGSRWEIILCDICGSQGCHVACGRLSFYKSFFECQSCQKILKNVSVKPKSNKRQRRDSRVVRRLGRSSTDPGYLKEVGNELVIRIFALQSELHNVPHRELSFVDSKVLDSESSIASSSSVRLLSPIEYSPIKRSCPDISDEYVDVENVVESELDNGQSDSEIVVDSDDELGVCEVSSRSILRLSDSELPSPVAFENSVVEADEPNSPSHSESMSEPSSCKVGEILN